MTKPWLWSLVTVLVVAAGSYAWFATTRGPELHEGILYGNGHIEAFTDRYFAAHIARIDDFAQFTPRDKSRQEAVMLAVIGAALYAAALLAFRRRIG